MNTQQQGFAPPETYYGDQHPINTDPREQPQWPGSQPPFATQPQPGHNPWRWMGISVAILVVIFGSLFAASTLLTSTVTETKSFDVGTQPTLVVNNGNGSVHIFNGPAGQISVVAHKHVWLGNSDQISVHYNLSSDHQTLIITADDGPGLCLFCFGVQSVDIDVTVPSQSNLNVHTGNGSVVSATGISGQITLDAGNGSIQATQLSGPLTLKTGNGSITATQTNASGNSTFQTGNGSIDFSGTLDPHQGVYLFTTGNGDIDLTLPANAALHVTYEVGNGSIDSDFTLTGDGTVGNAPYAQVTLHSGNGSIHLHKGN